MRDFFYNKGDVFIAILIILCAAFVIYLRVGVIMEYSASGEKNEGLLPMPPSLFGDGVSSEETPAQPQEVSAPTEQQPTEGPAVATMEDTPALPPVNTVQIVIAAGDVASTIAEKLYAVGAITDTQAFIAEVIAQGAESKLKIGTFTIPAGSTVAEVIKILVG